MSFTTGQLDQAIENRSLLVWDTPNKWNGLKEAGWYETDERLWSEVDYGKYAVVVDGKMYEIESVYHDGGGEGHAEHIESVIKVDGRLFRKSGYYASHDGEYWDGALEEVEAYQKMVTDYRRI